MFKQPAVVLAAAVAMGIPCSAIAAEYTLQPQLQFSALANDNIRLSEDDKEEVVGGILSPQLTFGYRDPNTDISLGARGDFNGYVVNSDLSSIDNRVDFHAGYQMERSYLSLDAFLNRDTIFETVDDNDVRILNDQRVTTISATPSYSFEVTPRDTVRLQAGFLDRDYGSSDRLIDYRFYTAGTDWSHEVTEIDTFILGAGYGHFDPDSSADDEDRSNSDIVDLQIGWQRQFTPNLLVRVVAGPSYISEGGDGDLGYNANARISYDFSERTTFSATYTLRSEPSSGGQVTENRSRLGVAVEHELTELLTLRFDGSYVGRETGSTGDTSSFSLQPSLTYQVSQEVDLSASYRFRHKDNDNTGEEASSNAVLLSVTYRPERWIWSD